MGGGPTFRSGPSFARVRYIFGVAIILYKRIVVIIIIESVDSISRDGPDMPYM